MDARKVANKILIAILTGLFALFFLGALAVAVYLTPRQRAAQSAQVKTLKPDSLFLGDFRPVQGTKYLISEVNKEYRASSYSSRLSDYFSYNSDSGAIHNLVFLESDSLSSRRLFDTNAYVITGVSQFPSPVIVQAQPGGQSQPEEIIVRSLVYQVVKKDTNQDGLMDANDLLSVGISDAGGSGYSELLSSLTRVYWMDMNGEDVLLIVYQQGDSKKVSRVDINSRKVTSTQTLADLGPEVK